MATCVSVSSYFCASHRLGSLPHCSTARAFSSTLATTATICSASQRANASLEVELVGNRFGQFNWPRNHPCRSLIPSTMPLTVVSPANFPKPQQRQQQRQRIAFSLPLASISHLFKRAIQRGRIDAQGFRCDFVSKLKYAKVHLRHFSLSLIGVFWNVPKYSKKWLTFRAFRVNQKALSICAILVRGVVLFLIFP